MLPRALLFGLFVFLCGALALTTVLLRLQQQSDGELKPGLGRGGWSQALELNELNNSSRGGKLFQASQQLWVVVAAKGVAVRENKSLGSNLVTVLPKGLVLLGQGLQFQREGQPLLRLQISSPAKGWVTALSDRQFLVRPLLLEPDETCQPADFLEFTDFKGGDLNPSPLNALSASECCHECGAVLGCQYWTYTTEGACWIKGAQAKQQPPSAELYKTLVSGKKVMTGSATPQAQPNRKRSMPACCSASPEGFSALAASLLQEGVCSDPSCWNADGRYSVHLSDLTAGRDGASLHDSAQFVLHAHKANNRWQTQWPLGNGLFGGLVGGTIASELIPLSVSDLFFQYSPDNPDVENEERVKRQAAPDNFRKMRQALARGDVDTAETLAGGMQYGRLGSFQYAFDLALHFGPGALALQKHTQPAPPQPPAAVKPQQVHGVLAKLPPAISRKLKPGLRQRMGLGVSNGNDRGRAPLLDQLLQAFGPEALSPPGDQTDSAETGTAAGRGGFGSVFLSKGLLDTRQGISYHTFIEGERPSPGNAATADTAANSKGESESALYLHQRHWFASQRDGVLAGRMACAVAEPNATASFGCLNLALSFDREPNPNHVPPLKTVSVQVLSQSALAAIAEERGTKSVFESETETAAPPLAQQSFLVTATLAAGPGMKVFPVHMTAIVTCLLEQGSWGDSAGAVGRFTARAVDSQAFASALGDVPAPDFHAATILCNGASAVEVIATLAIHKGEVDDARGVLRSLEESSNAAVTQAFSLGLATLRRRHEEYFSERMERLDLSLTSLNASQSCPTGDVSGRLFAFTSGCANDLMADSGPPVAETFSLLSSRGRPNAQPNQAPAQNVDSQLLAQAFQYGRYLLLSAGSQSVINLQGLWADGPTSSWSGDYHFNINFQMSYWAMHSAAVHEVAEPLQSFVQRLAHAGKSTARELYGCGSGAQQGSGSSSAAWVAHGFTDAFLDTGVLGESQWALCSTCGVWAALLLWEHALHVSAAGSDLQSLLVNHLLPVLRGAAEFFLEYFYEDSRGGLHTGPATSPENSFQVIGPVPPLTPVAKPQPAAAAVNPADPKNKPAPKLKPKPKPKPGPAKRTTFLALSPAIDQSVLRQLANALTVASQWARAGAAAGTAAASAVSYPAEQAVADENLASRFSAAAKRLPGGSMPIVGSNGLVLEFPNAYPDSTVGHDQLPPELSSQQPCERNVSELMDPGHRHFSSLHWFYPNSFHTEGERAGELRAAAAATLANKVDHGGGHTSWSAAWEACLWARLQEPRRVMTSLRRLLGHFSAPNLLSLHPPLMHTGPADCSTCFREDGVFASRGGGAGLVAASGRGLASVDDAKFQVDGNLGLVAALCEALVQSHVPGRLLLLPALPVELSERGRVSGLRARGDVTVSISWRRGTLAATTLLFHSAHPWLAGLNESSSADGFFAAREDSQVTDHFVSVSAAASLPIQMILEHPAGGGELFLHRNSSLCATASRASASTAGSPNSMTSASLLLVQVHSIPCEVRLCVKPLLQSACVDSAGGGSRLE